MFFGKCKCKCFQAYGNGDKIEGRMSSRVGMDRTTHVGFTNSRLPPRDDQLRSQTVIWVPGSSLPQAPKIFFFWPLVATIWFVTLSASSSSSCLNEYNKGSGMEEFPVGCWKNGRLSFEFVGRWRRRCWWQWCPSYQVPLQRSGSRCQVHFQFIRQSPTASYQSSHLLRHWDGQIGEVRPLASRSFQSCLQRSGEQYLPFLPSSFIYLFLS